MKIKKMKLEMKKMSNDVWRKDLEAEEKWLENCGEDEEFLKRESKRLHRDLLRIAPVYIGGANSENEMQFQGWESVAGLQDVIQCMKEVVILPLLYPEFFSNMGLTPPRGVLLHGYPGTGKTLVVRALIGSCARGDKRIAYFARKGADCLGKYVGDAERQLRLLFQVAEKSQPSIIFFDEIDGLAPCRTRQQDQTHNSVVSTLLALLDGLKSRGSVVVIGATNRPDAVDPALRRPGRFDREIYFPLPTVEDRAAILSLHTQRWPKPITGPVLDWIARKAVGFAGADLQALCTQAAIIALRRNCPFQEVLSAAEKKAPGDKRPPLPTVTVEERDWLEALLRAPPPCSQREAGMAANDVVSTPLRSHLSPCLLQPLSQLLVALYLDERILLPHSLYRAATLIKSVVISALGKKKVPNDNWWSHIQDLLQEEDCLREIEMKLSHVGILLGQASDSKCDAQSENSDKYSKVRQIVTRTNLLQNISHASGKKSGFRMLISGSPRSGQRYLASCLLNCFVGNVELQKIDLATISQEGNGDVIQGITHILMRCASVGSCMIFMPRIDLWAIETFDQVGREENYPSSTSSEPSDTSCMEYSQHFKETQFNQKICNLSETTVSQGASLKTSYIWNSFVEQVETICVATSLMILATSEVSFCALPIKLRQFFKSETLIGSLSTAKERIPQFSVDLDGSFCHDTVINSSAVELSTNIVQLFVHLVHHRRHACPRSCMVEKSCETPECDANTVSHQMDPVSVDEHQRKQFPESSFMKVSCPPNTRPLKAKSSLLLAISTFGYQILRYPHFAELCWVTSKLKEGPSADINGPWRGWPFNSCIVCPNKSLEKAVSACSSGSTKSKEKSGLVRGLIAIGLSAYRGMYNSLREVSFEVRKVLELLAGEINAKINAGKDRYQFIRLLSQMAYLEDVVNSWAYTLHSLEVDAQTTVPTPKLTGLGYLDNYNKRCADNIPQSNGCEPDVSAKSSRKLEVLEETRQVFDLNKEVGDIDPSSGERDMTKGLADQMVTASDVQIDNSNGKLMDEHNGWINPEQCTEEDPSISPFLGGDLGSFRNSNGFAYSDSSCLPGDHLPSGERSGVKPSSSLEAENQRNGLAIKMGIPSEDEANADTNFCLGNVVDHSNGSGVVCLYHCCPKCIISLHGLMQKIVTCDWGLIRSDCMVEDVHDVITSLSVNLHSIVRKFFVDESSTILSDQKRNDTFRKEMDECNCRGSEDRSMIPMECRCHSRTSASLNTEHGLDLKFVYKDGVVLPVDPSENISFHCKFETLCLCSLIEWIVMTKQRSD
ncbi:hypothetical protein NMG60_11003390 [Bertholletia excelsa]